MIKSHICVYCSIQIKKSKNSDFGRSVEHMIPQAAVNISRTNAQGDFHVCRKCNSEKSKIDALFGLVSRLNSSKKSAQEAAIKLSSMAKKGNKTVIRMMDTAEMKGDIVNVTLPFKGDDIYKYGVFLTKGEFFKQNRKILNMREKVVFVTWGGSNFINKLSKEYHSSNQRDPFQDLAKNNAIENVNQECFIVANKNTTEFVFFFGRAYVLITKIAERTSESLAEKRQNKLSLIAGFSRNETNKYCV